MTGFALGVHEDLVKSGTNPLERLKGIIKLDAELLKSFQTSLAAVVQRKHPAIKLATW